MKSPCKILITGFFFPVVFLIIRFNKGSQSHVTTLIILKANNSLQSLLIIVLNKIKLKIASLNSLKKGFVKLKNIIIIRIYWFTMKG